MAWLLLLLLLQGDPTKQTITLDPSLVAANGLTITRDTQGRKFSLILTKGPLPETDQRFELTKDGRRLVGIIRTVTATTHRPGVVFIHLVGDVERW